ncbi:hypothetical protein BJ322DRAFT_1105964 [Thelephora terrestris]|uniref:Tubby C-terminal domain-containing protein n=1 Tax=Thelephora terrestris TaxID=56493 RepID=A0A9P6HIL4_9AGAM|nr:hypothetical protein BJ322DRAFT_1105964 [Thelephora terrestris]
MNPLSLLPAAPSSLLFLTLASDASRKYPNMLTPTNMNPFAEWSTRSSDSSPSIFGALPSIPIAPTLPVFISDSLVLRFSATNDVLNCALLGPQNRTLFSVSSSGSRTSFQNVENAVFAIVDFAPHATVEVQGFTPRQRVREWLRLAPDQSSRLLILGDEACSWRPMGHHIVLMSQDNTVLGRITRSANTTALEITRPALVSNLLYPCIVSATLFLSGRHID